MASEELLRNIRVPPREAIAYLAGKTNVTTQHYTDVWREAHTRSFMVAGAATDALVGDFRTDVARAIEQGTTLQDFRKQFDSIVSRHGWEHNGSPGWRSRIIYETNLSTAYAAGRYAQQTEPDTLAVYPFWQYVHSGAAHPRLQHQAWNGLTLRADDPFWRTHYPPNGWRCGCRVRVLSARGLARQGRSGPDQAPAIETRPWRNPRTGEVQQVPIGIDPGFDYNPGLAWRGEAQVPGDAVTRTPPGNWPPAAPRLPNPRPPAMPQPDGTSPAPATLGGDDDLGRVWITEPGSDTRIVPSGTPVSPDYREWAEGIAASRRHDGTARIVGELSRPVMQALAREGVEPLTSAIGITARRVTHLVRDAKVLAGKALPIEDVMRLPEILREPRAVLRQLPRRNQRPRADLMETEGDRPSDTLLLVYDAPSSNGRIGKIVVQLNVNARVRHSTGDLQVIFNSVTSGGLVDAHQLRAVEAYQTLWGEV